MRTKLTVNDIRRVATSALHFSKLTTVYHLNFDLYSAMNFRRVIFTGVGSALGGASGTLFRFKVSEPT